MTLKIKSEKNILLSDREKLILEIIVRSFINSAKPVASSVISQLGNLALSPATIRNIMAVLEEKGYIYQPHTSAGRIPTTAGYRLFVDQIMRKSRLSLNDKEKIQLAVSVSSGDFETLFRESSRILAQLSQQLSIIVTPGMEEGVFHRMEITRLDSQRLLLIISIRNGMVKTIILEINSPIKDKQLEQLRQLLNERLSGLKLKDIRNNFRKIVTDISDDETSLMHLFIDTADQIFDFSEEIEIFQTGTYNILNQPEFSDFKETSNVVKLIEDKNIIIHLMDKGISSLNLSILIGEEIEEERLKNCSLITARYKIGSLQGLLGIVGPKRMDYSHIIPLIEYTANTLTDSYET